MNLSATLGELAAEMEFSSTQFPPCLGRQCGFGKCLNMKQVYAHCRGTEL